MSLIDGKLMSLIAAPPEGGDLHCFPCAPSLDIASTYYSGTIVTRLCERFGGVMLWAVGPLWSLVLV